MDGCNRCNEKKELYKGYTICPDCLFYLDINHQNYERYMAVRPFTHIMRKPLMTIGVKEISEDQYDHFFYKWLYTYGGTSDVKTLEQYIKEYDIDLYGDVDIYSTSVCPCVMCIGEDIV